MLYIANNQLFVLSHFSHPYMQQQTARFSLKAQKDFIQTLKERVSGYFSQKSLSPFGNVQLYLKAIIWISVYWAALTVIFTQILPFWANLILFFVMGVAMAGIGMGVMHDSVHGSYSTNKNINRWLGHTMDMLGGSSFNWRVQHNVLHHTYTNIPGLDEDITGKPFLRFEPTGKWRPYHRYQHIYGFFLYCFMTLSWIIKGDVMQLIDYSRRGLAKQVGTTPAAETIKMIISKTLYLSLFFVFPIFVLGIAWWQMLVGLILIHAVAGFILAIVFQLAHVVEPTEYFQPDNNGNIENSWAVHQLYTTANFGKHQKLMSWYVGGLNYQIEHHLFPNISHVHYPAISGIVKETAAEFNLPYNEFPTFGAALKSHVRRLKELGRKPVVIGKHANIE